MSTNVVFTIAKGACLCASRDIRRGELILAEHPICFIKIHDYMSDLAPQVLSILSHYPSLASRPDVLFALQVSQDIKENNVLLKELQSLACNPIATMPDMPGSIATCIDSCHFDEVRRKLQQNGMLITDYEQQPQGIGLYSKAARINHSCRPNTAQTFEGNQLRIHATRDIPVNEEISISYIDLALPTHLRRSTLYQQYGFYCMCQRCTVTEAEYIIKCHVAKCSGWSRICCQDNVYRHWLEGTFATTVTTPESSILYALNSLLHVSGITFKCDACYSIMDFQALCDIIVKCERYIRAYTKQVSPSTTLAKLYHYIYNHLPTESYAIIDIGSKVEMLLLQSSKYKLAVELNINLLPYFVANYCASPVVVMQLWQITKLCNACNRRQDAVSYYELLTALAMDVFGADCDVSREIREFGKSIF